MPRKETVSRGEVCLAGRSPRLFSKELLGVQIKWPHSSHPWPRHQGQEPAVMTGQADTAQQDSLKIQPDEGGGGAGLEEITGANTNRVCVTQELQHGNFNYHIIVEKIVVQTAFLGVKYFCRIQYRSTHAEINLSLGLFVCLSCYWGILRM